MGGRFLASAVGFVMERKRAFQMKQRFERCKTPSGSVPISVIMGFDYPLASDREESGRGEGRSSSSYSVRGPGGPGGYRSNITQPGSYSSSLNTDYMNRHMQDRLPRPPTTCWPSSLSQSRTSTQKTYLSRAVTEAREPSARPERGFTSSFALEHPKQQPCQYASALSMTALPPPQPRHSRATTVMPPSRSSVWSSNTNNTFTQPRTATFSSYASKFSSPSNSSRFSNIRSRFAY